MRPPTVAEALAAAARRIEAAGHAARPRREAEELLGHLLARERAWLVAHGDERLEAASAAALDAAVARREAGEPIAYVTGCTSFCGRTFAVSPAVLIPRPETEMIVELAREEPPGRAVDVGTGSGCLAVTISLERSASVVAVDLSLAALEVARRNAATHRARIDAVRADGLTALQPTCMDLVVANPPYVHPREREELPLEVKGYEPALALFSPGGTTHVARWLDDAVRVLAPGGRLLFEIGFAQEQEVRALAARHPSLRELRIHPDFQGIPRVLDARRGTSPRPTAA